MFSKFILLMFYPLHSVLSAIGGNFLPPYGKTAIMTPNFTEIWGI